MFADPDVARAGGSAAEAPARRPRSARRRGLVLGAASLQRVVVINDDAVESGGAAAVALTSARLLRSRGLRVSFLTGDGGSNPGLCDAGVDVVTLGGRHIMYGARAAAAVRGLFDPVPLAGLRRWIAEHDTPGTVYHLHNWHKVLSPSVFLALRSVAPRLVMSAHDYFLACPNGGFFHYPRGRPCELEPLGAACLSASCDRRHYVHKLWRVARQQVREGVFDLQRSRATVLAVHEGMVPYLQRGRIGPDTVQVLRNPVTPWRGDRVPAERNRGAFFIGRLEEDKGVDLLARAARQARVALTVIGSGPLSDRLAAEHPEIRLLGWRSRKEIAELIGDARMVCVPTRWRETFGLVTLEALMSGVPVVASRFSLISDEIVALGLGVACDPHDEAALAAAMARLADDDDAVADMSRAAFAEARRLAPTPGEWCDALIAIYRGKIDAASVAAEHGAAEGMAGVALRTATPMRAAALPHR